MYYTLGQRGGIGIGGMKGAEEVHGSFYIKILNNRLVIGQGHEHPLMQSTLWSETIDWVAGEQEIPTQVSDARQKPVIASLIKRVQFIVMTNTKMVFVLSLMNHNVL
jgi:tRNA U34 2-thiouridine synthase MnmA/TrmU